MAFSSEEPLSEEHWKEEASSVINDIKDHVKDVHVSQKLKSNNKFIYLNLTTEEEENFCIELSGAGFRIVGNTFDDDSQPRTKIYETPYSLLDEISPKYRESFGTSLVNKLKALQNT
ncbi:GSK3-beta interaction protein-like [Schistocerca gregaria]|uniref:GSK3-beta interaction protein-like n=1 Tax=Schistocerca gregaria TaxID=7010 RepID=UPI00211F18BE|nr:GSK3-beta interaction protein-like [Schistocerca gregaria]